MTEQEAGTVIAVMTHRGLRVLRAGPLASAVALTTVLLTAAPAMAVVRDDGDDPGQGLSVLETFVWFVGAPLLLAAVITGLVYAGGRDRSRYRSGVPWKAAPLWFNGPGTDPPTGSAGSGELAPVHARNPGGGASARW